MFAWSVPNYEIIDISEDQDQAALIVGTVSHSFSGSFGLMDRDPEAERMPLKTQRQPPSTRHQHHAVLANQQADILPAGTPSENLVGRSSRNGEPANRSRSRSFCNGLALNSVSAPCLKLR